ncbi:hypothetical protein Ga0466249_004645 [Sporomusaceae bacterium BoRhaA]|nr:hypothetical protein [Pelorhabdus rhamnosifermentans]
MSRASEFCISLAGAFCFYRKVITILLDIPDIGGEPDPIVPGSLLLRLEMQRSWPQIPF